MSELSPEGLSWGRFPRVSQRQADASPLKPILPLDRLFLPRGMGRSYGDSCLNSRGQLLSTSKLDHLVSFDPETSCLVAEAGVRLAEIIHVFGPKGYFLPVSPGTKWVTLGGAVANDIHGKNHHLAGSFGNHVVELLLLRSNGERLHCSRLQNSELFFATIGGLGLTGLVLEVTIKLKKVSSLWIDQNVTRFRSLDEFYDLSLQKSHHEYTVAWIDCLNPHGRGLFIAGDHSSRTSGPPPVKTRKLRVPFTFPSITLNPFTVRAFNWAYFHRQLKSVKASTVSYDPFFYPLDVIHDWNLIYGSAGFVQYQFVVPPTNEGKKALSKVFQNISESGEGSFLAVLKTFGDIPSEGCLSFSRPGYTLALDFKVKPEVFKLLDRLDDLVFSCGGALYPAKDARMSPQSFRASFPDLQKFLPHIDPKISSDFARRMEIL
ncbi:MAG: FAD-binding oxidoreductase [Proteobacteria bacterium]|nr:FAD-binding oxidoreductase [Pseudomonadota bacterium]